MEESFKSRVKLAIIENAKDYKQVFIDYEYLICSEAFKDEPYYIITSTNANYLHLTGVNAFGKATDFFSKCFNSTLTEDDFDFHKKHQSEKEVIGYVRKKIKTLPLMMNLFNGDIVACEGTLKKKIKCTFATGDGNFTLGFISLSKPDELTNRKTHKVVPMSLLKGNELDENLTKKVDLVLRKSKNEKSFSRILIGNLSSVNQYSNKIKKQVSILLLLKAKFVSLLDFLLKQKDAT